MEVHVEVDGRPEALHVRHSTGGRVAEPFLFRPRAVPGEDRLDEHPPQRREHVGAERRQRAKLEREREHPLPHGHCG